MKQVGFKPLSHDWKSVFWHDALKLLLVVYVDDFKLAGPSDNMAKGWKLISEKIKMEPYQSVGRYLGCDQKMFSTLATLPYNPRHSWMKDNPVKKSPPIIWHKESPKGKKNINIMKYDMRSFLEQCVEVSSCF